MNTFRWLTGLSAVSLLMFSCSNTSRNAPAALPVNSRQAPTVSLSAAPVAPKQADVAAATTQQTTPVPGLLPATDPDQRRSQITRQKQDPFAAVTVPSTAVPSRIPSDSSAVLNPPDLTRFLPEIPLPDEPETKPAPPITASPDTANAVQITGVLKMEGQLVAIVEAPNEPTSRSVAAGDYLSNGKVKVKQIELGAGGEPLVTLEENGVEVIKSVGTAGSSSATIR